MGRYYTDLRQNGDRMGKYRLCDLFYGRCTACLSWRAGRIYWKNLHGSQGKAALYHQRAYLDETNEDEEKENRETNEDFIDCSML